MDKNQWSHKNKNEQQYKKALEAVMKKIGEAIKPLSDPFKIVSTVKNIIKNSHFLRYAESVAKTMVTGLFVDNKRNWKAAARESMQGRKIFNALKDELSKPVMGTFAHEIARNAEVIKTLPLDVASKVTDYIAEQTIKGKRSSEIAKEIQTMFPQASKAKATLIARTEVSKTTTALTQARAQSVGLNWYVWGTSDDARVRPAHDLMDEVLIKWTESPAPEALNGQKSEGHYHAGAIYNCRCFAKPLVTIDDVRWPHKVYYNGAINTITRAKFEEIM
jgi:SPP1 gp7 family putative phage head morphogenesis protein